MKRCIGTPNPTRWKGTKEMTFDSPVVGFDGSRSGRSHPEEGRISHAWATSNISPSALEVSHFAMVDQPGAYSSKLGNTRVEGRWGKQK